MLDEQTLNATLTEWIPAASDLAHRALGELLPPEGSTVSSLAATVALPLLAALIGTLIGQWRPLGLKGHSHLQHLTAGILFSVVAVEILPEVIHRQTPFHLTLGFAAGVALMMSLAALSHRFQNEGGRADWPLTLMAGTAIDLFLDGVILVLTSEAVSTAGQTLSLALTIEMLTVSLSLSGTFKRRRLPRGTAFVASSGVLSTLGFGAVAGHWILPALPPESRDLVLSFGLAALLFLVTEELLVEPHREVDAPLSTLFFFSGFLAFLLLGQQHG